MTSSQLSSPTSQCALHASSRYVATIAQLRAARRTTAAGVTRSSTAARNSAEHMPFEGVDA